MNIKSNKILCMYECVYNVYGPHSLIQITFTLIQVRSFAEM